MKTHLQSQAVKEIAVGFQHSHSSMSEGLRSIYFEHGILGLWRGVGGAAGRVTVGSAAQLASFSSAKEFVVNSKVSWHICTLAGRDSTILCHFHLQAGNFHLPTVTVIILGYSDFRVLQGYFQCEKDGF